MESVSVSQKISNPRKMKGPAVTLMRTLFRHLGPIAPTTMGSLANRLWFSPRRIKRPAWEVELGRTAQERFTVAAGKVRVKAWAWGHGPTVLLVHGWEGRGTQLGHFVNPLLEQGFRVVCFDGPGHGDSGGSQTDAVELGDIIQAIDVLEGGLFGIVSHSFGAVPCAFAVRKGLTPARVAMISPPSEFSTMLSIFAHELAIPQVVMADMKRRIEDRFPGMGSALWSDLSTHNSARTFRFPGLLIHDVDDPVVPIAQGRLIANSWPDVRHVETQGLGHRRILKDSAVISDVVRFMTGS